MCLHVFSVRGADVNAVNTEGCTPLHEAVTRGDEEVVEELLIHKADPTLKIMIGYVEKKFSFSYPIFHSSVFIRGFC